MAKVLERDFQDANAHRSSTSVDGGGFLINEMSKTPFQFADPTLHIESIKLAYQIFMLPAPCFD